MVNSDQLEAYPLPAPVAETLASLDTAAQTLARRGVAVPAVVVVEPLTYALVDRLVRYYSRGEMDARSVNWRGRPLALAA